MRRMCESGGFYPTHKDVSENRGTPKSSILIEFSIVNHPFWGTPIIGNTHNLFFGGPTLRLYTFSGCHFPQPPLRERFTRFPAEEIVWRECIFWTDPGAKGNPKRIRILYPSTNVAGGFLLRTYFKKTPKLRYILYIPGFFFIPSIWEGPWGFFQDRWWNCWG